MIPGLSFFRELNLISAILRILLASVIGIIIGRERRLRGRPAGARTYAIVCIGSCLAMMTDMYLAIETSYADAARIGAQVISGIGFLGAGTILVKSDNRIQGLTTAASLWASACLGLACGAGFFEGAILGFITIIIVTWVLPRFENSDQNSDQ